MIGPQIPSTAISRLGPNPKEIPFALIKLINAKPADGCKGKALEAVATSDIFFAANKTPSRLILLSPFSSTSTILDEALSYQAATPPEYPAKTSAPPSTPNSTTTPLNLPKNPKSIGGPVSRRYEDNAN